MAPKGWEVVSVRDATKERLQRLQNELQMKSLGRVSMDDVLRYLLDKEELLR